MKKFKKLGALLLALFVSVSSLSAGTVTAKASDMDERAVVVQNIELVNDIENPKAGEATVECGHSDWGHVEHRFVSDRPDVIEVIEGSLFDNKATIKIKNPNFDGVVTIYCHGLIDKTPIEVAKVTVKKIEGRKVYIYSLVPGVEFDSSKDPNSVWNGMGVGRVNGLKAPKDYPFDTNLLNTPGIRIDYPDYPDITINGKTYKFAPSYSENATKEGYYTFQEKKLVVAGGANAGNNKYNETVDDSIMTFHLDGEITYNTSDLFKAEFKLKDVGSSSFETVNFEKFTKMYPVNTNESNIKKPVAGEDIASSKTVNNVNYVFDGWYLDENFTIKANFDRDLSENVTYYGRYVHEKYNLTVNYIDEKGNSLHNSFTKDVKFNDEFSVESPVIEGHTLKDASQAIVTGKMGAGNVEIDVVYTTNTYKLQVHFVDTDGNALINDNPLVYVGPYSMDIKYGQGYCVTAPEVKGYSLVEGETGIVSGIMPAKDLLFEVVYSKNTYDLIVNYVDTEGKQLAKSEKLPVVFTENYKVDSPVIEGYSLVDETQATVSGEMGTEDLTINVVYAKNPYTLTVNYVDEAGNKLVDSAVKDVLFGDSYSVESPVIEGYSLVDEAQATVSVEMGAEDLTINVVYAKNAYTLTINYVDEDGNTLVDSAVKDVLFGDTISVDSPVIEGYSLVDETQATVSVEMGAEDLTIDVVYAKDAEPEVPVVPEEPTEPTDPEVPSVPETPEVPEEPETPVVPEEPEVPTVPETPEVPAEPETPSRSEVVTPVSPVTPDEPELPTEDVEDLETPQGVIEDVDDQKTPLSTLGGNWALANLILAGLSVVLGLVLLLSKNSKEDEDSEMKRSMLAKGLGVVVAALSVVVFFLTEDLSLQMTLVDKWTFLMAVLALVQVVVLVVGRKWKSSAKSSEVME